MAQIKLKGTHQQLEQSLNKYLSKYTKKAFRTTVNDMAPIIKKFLIEQVTNCSEFKRLVAEEQDLYGAFGTTELAEVISQIPQEMEKDIVLIPKFSGGRLLGSITFKVINKNYEKYLEIPGASYVSAKSGSLIEWLKWILIDGDVRIDEWHILMGTNLKGSRTGVALMKKGGYWVLPDPFTGDNENNNFITRAITVDPERLNRSIINRFYKELQNAINVL